MGLDTFLDLFQILTQPIITKADTGIRIGICLGLFYGRLKGIQIMDDLCEGVALGTGIRRSDYGGH